MIEIPLHDQSGGLRGIALVDDCDARLAQSRWCMDRDGYAVRAVYKPRQRLLRMHRVVLGLKSGDPEVDHINGNRLDNRRANLRLASPVLNQQNIGLQERNTSGFQGVHLAKPLHRGHPWQGRASVDGRRVSLGYFATAQEAGDAVRAFRSEHLPYSREAA